MSYYKARSDIGEMLTRLEDAGMKVSELTKYIISFDDKETTVFSAVRDAYDDYFEDELKEEAEYEDEQWALVDEAFEEAVK
jgi:enamine deaminase RidA (YjgF/YER057c/UK114 family)